MSPGRLLCRSLLRLESERIGVIVHRRGCRCGSGCCLNRCGCGRRRRCGGLLGRSRGRRWGAGWKCRLLLRRWRCLDHLFYIIRRQETDFSVHFPLPPVVVGRIRQLDNISLLKTSRNDDRPFIHKTRHQTRQDKTVTRDQSQRRSTRQENHKAQGTTITRDENHKAGGQEDKTSQKA